MEEKLKKIDERIDEIDSEIYRLTNLRKRLKAEREKLIDKRSIQISAEKSEKNWKSETFDWSKPLRDELKKTFGLEDFRPLQLETINATLSNQDLIYVAPTGGGKSLTFQLPAVISNGITLCISPLISLMEDQLYSLKKRNIKAEMLSMSSEKELVNRIHKLLEDPSPESSKHLKLLYVTPERLAKSKRLMSCLQKCYKNNKLSRIAIDEVHCISVMGHDYRPDYKFLGTLKTLFPNTCIIGVTATASKKVLLDVQKLLNIRGCIIFSSPFNRPNLYYHVLEKPSEADAVYDLLADLLLNRYAKQSGIIYTFSIKDTETLTSELLQRDCRVRPYHAQLEPHQRSQVYQKWMNNEIQAVCATIAFGLGIDKPDVKFVIHHTMSKSMENFYQESGRCGRSGEYAESILLFRLGDLFKISTMTFSEMNGLKNTYSMVDYCINSKTCRRDQFSKYFTEVWSDKNCGKMCDSCYFNSNRYVKPPKMDILKHYQTMLKIIEKAHSADSKMTALKLIDAWFHKGPKSSRIDIQPPEFSRSLGEQILTFLIVEKYLMEDFHYTPYATNSYIVKGPKIVSDNEIEFQPSRIYELPHISELENFYKTVSTEKNVVEPDDVSSPEVKKRKTITIDSSELEKLINEKVNSTIKRMLPSSQESSSSVAEKNDNESCESDEDVVFIKHEDEVIRID